MKGPAFTGWLASPSKENSSTRLLTTTGQKTFFGQTGNWNGQDILK